MTHYGKMEAEYSGCNIGERQSCLLLIQKTQATLNLKFSDAAVENFHEGYYYDLRFAFEQRVQLLRQPPIVLVSLISR